MGTCETLKLVVLGHVDHGKSTVVGHLLAAAGALPEGRLEAVREYAFVLDALQDERSQGITIEAARVHFRSDRRRFLVVDAPGHLDFLRNMVTGASHADAALLILDAVEGVRENSRRHGVLASLLGIRHLLVAVNKMDLVDWSQERFTEVAAEAGAFLADLGLVAAGFLPVSGLEGDNLVGPSVRMPWHAGPSLLEALDALDPVARERDGMLRLYVQDVYRMPDRRIVVGTVDSGSVGPGDELVFHPSGRRARVRTLESPPDRRAGAGEAVGFTLEPEVYVSRGELAAAPEAPPRTASRLQTSVFWLGREPLVPDRDYTLKIGTAAVPAQLVEVQRRLDAATLESRPGGGAVERNCVADCVLKLRRPVSCDEVDLLPETGRFVLVDGHRIAGGGIVRRVLPEPEPPGAVSAADRAARLGHGPELVLCTRDAHAVEARLFARGRAAYLLEDVSEPAVRALLDAGLVVVLAAEAGQVEELRALAGPHPVVVDP